MSRAGAFSVSRGFSLFELLVVMVILVLLGLVSIPWFKRIGRRAQLRSAAMEISTTIVAARMRAVKRNVNTSVVITAAATLDGVNKISTIEPPPAVLPTPSANSLSDLLISGRTLRFLETSGGTITFDGGGRRIAPPAPTPEATIVIEGPPGSTSVNQITIHTSTGGRVRVITPTVWQ